MRGVGKLMHNFCISMNLTLDFQGSSLYSRSVVITFILKNIEADYVKEHLK